MKLTVSEIMTGELVTVGPGDSVDHVTTIKEIMRVAYREEK